MSEPRRKLIFLVTEDWYFWSHRLPMARAAQAAGFDVAVAARVTAHGDVANKIGTYLKALAAKDNNVPFYVALPSSTIDWELASGRDSPIEERSQDEVLKMTGRLPDGSVALVEIAAPGSSEGRLATAKP